MTIFPQYEQGLRDLAQRRRTAVEPTPTRRVRSLSWRAGVLGPAVGVVAAIAVAVGALLTLGSHRDHTAATQPPAVARHPSPAPLPVSSLSQLHAVLGVLRRAQVPGDRTDPFFKSHSALRPILRDERLVVSTSYGTRIWVSPARPCRAR